MASRKEYEMLFQLNAQMGGGFNSSFSKAQQQIASLQKEIQTLSKTQSDIAAYQKQQSAVESTRSKLATLQQQYDNIQKEIKETEGYSSSLENKLLSKQQQIDKTTASLKNQTEKLDSMGDALREAGIDTDNLTQESAELSAKMGELKSKQEGAANSAQKFGTSSVDALEAAQSALMAAGLAKLYREITEEIVKCVEASIEFESAITGVFKTVDGTDEQLQNIKQGIKDMSTEIPATTTEISSVAEAAGQLGIATDDVLSFTRVMIDLGESTNLTADNAATSLAKFSNITRTEAANYSRLGSVVVDLGNNYATTEADIVAMSTRLASSGTIAGLTEAEIMALAASMSSVGIEAEAGGTAMTQTLSAIETAVATNSEELKEFARVSGMSAQEFSSTWRNAPVQAIQAFITGLGSLDEKGESSVLVLEKLGLTGIRQSNMLKSLGLAAETMGDAVNTANKAWEENTALSVEANKRYATTESRLKMLKNSYSNLEVAIGDAYTPALVELSEVGSDILESVTEFVKANPELIRVLTALGIGVAAFTVALVGYIAVAKLAKAATQALTAAMKANPYLLAASALIGVVTALGSLVALSVTAERNVDKLTASADKQQQEIASLKKEYEKLCSEGKEASEEAQYLKYKIDNLSESFEQQKRTVSEYVEESQKLREQWEEESKANQKAANEIEINGGRTQALITRLSELAKQTDKTAASQEEMKAIIAELNELLPNVAFNYDDVKNGLGEIEQLLKNEATAQENLTKAQTARDNMIDASKRKADASSRLANLKKEYELEQELNKTYKEQYEAADKAYTASIKMVSEQKYEWDEEKAKARSEALQALEASNEALKQYSTEISNVEGELSKYNAEYESFLKTIVETSGITVESIDAMNELDEAIASASLNMQSLASTYSIAYTLAKDSFEGQFALFNQAKEDMEATVSSAQTALDSQLKFWENYAKNVETLKQVSAQDLGVTQENYDMIMSYAQSGTEEAAGFAKSLADAVKNNNTEAITKLAETAGAVKEAREKAAGEVAAWQVDFQGKMDEIVKTMETSLKEMNMSDEAIEAAKSTMNAYAKSVSSEGEKAVSKAVEIANQVRAELQKASTTITVKVKTTGDKTSGYATGVEHATPGAHWVGENGPELLWFEGGETVLNAQRSAALAKEHSELSQMQIVSFLPLMQTYLEASKNYISAQTAEPLYAKSASANNKYDITISPQFVVEGGSADDMGDKLQEFSNVVVGYVLDALEESGIDSARRSYT